MNQDLDGDGIADLNIDLDDDGICDINCDTDKDGLPDRNIDYHNNRKPKFNVLMDDDTLFNPVNQDTNNDGKCDINCDSNADGWPDYNIDYDGDGEIDLDRDTNNDGIKDLDLDFNGDGVCDLNCDDDKDNLCDRNCATIDITGNGGGTSQEGDGDYGLSSANLIVIFESRNNVVAENIYPDDQEEGEGINTTVPDLVFTVENTTNRTLTYNLGWLINSNTFETDNFWYRVVSDNGGFNQSWITAPFETTDFATNVEIAPNTTQTYRISFTLHGTGEEQNIDQGKVFDAEVTLELNE